MVGSDSWVARVPSLLTIHYSLLTIHCRIHYSPVTALNTGVLSALRSTRKTASDGA